MVVGTVQRESTHAHDPQLPRSGPTEFPFWQVCELAHQPQALWGVHVAHEV